MEKKIVYLVVGEVDYEAHDFRYAKVFINEKDAIDYRDSVLARGSKFKKDNWENGYYGYPEIIELELV